MAVLFHLFWALMGQHALSHSVVEKSAGAAFNTVPSGMLRREDPGEQERWSQWRAVSDTLSHSAAPEQMRREQPDSSEHSQATIHKTKDTDGSATTHSTMDAGSKALENDTAQAGSEEASYLSRKPKKIEVSMNETLKEMLKPYLRDKRLDLRNVDSYDTEPCNPDTDCNPPTQE